ncbi:MAG: response regulator transcription factor, partial [Eubacterium sp.]|nr:response regulator transcription factor [Eubacterium sp.]
MVDILIIEDDPELRGLLADFMRAEDFSVEEAESAEAGIEYLNDNLTRIILLDIMLPGIDGFAACASIRNHKDIPIIIMSARGDDESKLMGYKLGADDYIEKPVSIPILMAKIKALLHRSETTVDTNENPEYENISIDTVK